MREFLVTNEASMRHLLVTTASRVHHRGVAASSNVIALFTHRAALRRARPPARVLTVYDEELVRIERLHARFATAIMATTALLIGLLLAAF